jgi:hypothetical protein
VTQASPDCWTTAIGARPTSIVLVTDAVARSTIETVFESMFGTQSSPPITVEASGFEPTGIGWEGDLDEMRKSRITDL